MSLGRNWTKAQIIATCVGSAVGLTMLACTFLMWVIDSRAKELLSPINVRLSRIEGFFGIKPAANQSADQPLDSRLLMLHLPGE